MDKNFSHAHIWPYFFWPLLSHFGPIELTFLWELRRLLYIDWCCEFKKLSFIFEVLGFLTERWAWPPPPSWYGAFKPDKKAGPLSLLGSPLSRNHVSRHTYSELRGRVGL